MKIRLFDCVAEDNRMGTWHVITIVILSCGILILQSIKIARAQSVIKI